MNEPDDTGLPEPCQPIGCDSGYHIPGCVYAEVDLPDVPPGIDGADMWWLEENTRD